MGAGGIVGGSIKVKCPHCGTVQMRARSTPAGGYKCRKCGKTIPAPKPRTT